MICGNSYIKEYKDYIFVNNVGKIFRTEYINVLSEAIGFDEKKIIIFKPTAKEV